MPYIGRDTDKLSNVEVLDKITFDGSQSYTLQKGGVNFTPSSANNILISVDGVVQADNFTCSGSTIDFGVAIASSSTCDFILHYGVGLITTPADGTITNAKLAASAINSQTAETSIAGGDEVLIYDTSASALRKMTRTNFVSGVGGANTPAFLAYQSSAQTIATASNVKIQFDTELFDSDGMYDHSTNYRFTPTTAGKYVVGAKIKFNNCDNARVYTMIYKNGSEYERTEKRNDSGNSDPDPISNLIIDFNGSSDYVEVYGRQESGGNIDTNVGVVTRMYFFAYKIIGA